ncbi:AAA family ATPase [Curtobacterium sp. 22159]|uniref:AAA family ATPase n=1 Tax=Curtobacterium sp. 22159 TaxID=3453882 RepID=UPI003F837026
MTTIREIRISNLAGRSEELHEFLRPDVNVFWGLNGTGKTTLLKILHAALRNETATLKHLPFSRAEIRFYSEHRDADIVRTYDKTGLSIESNDQPTLWTSSFTELDADDDRVNGQLTPDSGWDTKWLVEGDESTPLDRTFKHAYLPISRMLGDRQGFRQHEDNDQRFARHVNQVWSAYSSKSLASVRDTQQYGLAEILAILFNGSPATPLAQQEESQPDPEAAAAYRLVSDFMWDQQLVLPLGQEDFTARYEHSDSHRLVVSKIREIMAEVDEILAPQRELQAVIDDSYIGNKHLVLSRSETVRRNIGIEINRETIPLGALSSGEKQLLQILLETLAVEESTIIIDEPELSLHPDWQRGLVASMRRVNSRAQFILATHSPDLQVDVDDESIFEL